MRKGLVVLFAAAAAAAQDWPTYHGSPANTKYSALTQINTSNVARLKLAWRFDTGDYFKGAEMQSSPLVAGSTVYVVSPKMRVFALDAETGRQKWAADPNEGPPVTANMRNRGLNYWSGGKQERLYLAVREYLYSLDARTGKLDPRFGEKGRVDLRKGLGRDVTGLSVTITTPGVVFGNLLIVGSMVSESLPAAPGHVRAYDTRSGKLVWTFYTIPKPGTLGADTWPAGAQAYIGGANSWAGLALDGKRGIVYVPTGSAAFDFFGSNRAGDNLYANSLVALKAATGERLWHFQFVKHDVWDRDLPAAPTLVTVRRGGRSIDAVAQITKSGHVWVFDRVTGESLFPWKDVPVPPSDVHGEVLARTQPLPLAPPPFSRQEFTEDLVTDRTPQARESVLQRLRQVRNGPQFTPPSLEGTVVFPGFDGGGEWGGASWDPETGLFYVNANEMAWILRLVPSRKGALNTGKKLYSRHCASCHREDFAGAPPNFPSLENLVSRQNEKQVMAVIEKGAGRMPAFGFLREDARDAITRYVLKGEDKEVMAPPGGGGEPWDLPYGIDGYNRFRDPQGYPAVKPPWGTLNALNLNTGEYAWRIPFGEFPELVAQGLRDTGSENYGGSVVTKGGLLFIAATKADNKFRAFDKLTGKVLWEYTMEAAGHSTPATFVVKGRQYVLQGAGGGKYKTEKAGIYYAFALD
ncbi:MAG TPA: pyrrolo-quinoline quinone [Solibacterales bacterium]|nr:pyrrolo-quinoline quinone [Bryobacterales bacterium]